MKLRPAHWMALIVYGTIACAAFAFFCLMWYLSQTHYSRVNEGPIYEEFMGKCFQLTEDQVRLMQEISDDEKAQVFVIEQQYNRTETKELSPYLLTTYSWKDQEIAVLSEFPIRYRVIDIYHVVNWGGSRNIALCVLCDVDGLEDIVFEEWLPSEYKLRNDGAGAYTQDMLSAEKSRGTCEWSEERYQKVINSPRCKLRKRFRKLIAPGDRSRNAWGWW